MGTVTLRDYPNEQLKFTLPNVVEDPIIIKIHLVRVYKDRDTIISVIKLRTNNENHYYTSIVRDHKKWTRASARKELYQGYLLTPLEKFGSKWLPDSPAIRNRILEMFKKLNKSDTRLHKTFQKGGKTGTSHNGLRIYNKNRTSGSPIGGGKMFHTGVHYGYSKGCEVVGNSAIFKKGQKTSARNADYKSEDIYVILESHQGMLSFMDNIIKVYEANVLEKNQRPIHINIEVEDKFIKNLSKENEIYPNIIYAKLFPKPKVEPLKSSGFTKIKIKNTKLPDRL